MEIYCFSRRKRVFLPNIPPYKKRNHPNFLYFLCKPGTEWDDIYLRDLEPLDMETYEPKNGEALIYINVLSVCFAYMTMNTYMMRLLYNHAKVCVDPACMSNNCFVVKYMLKHLQTCSYYYDCPYTGLCYYIPELFRSLHICKEPNCFTCMQSTPSLKRQRIYKK